jgi:hypothetical protein
MSREPAYLVCIAWGALWVHELEHVDCPVILENAAESAVAVKVDLPALCPCECRTCKRAWWAKGRPLVRDGKIVTERSS